MTICNFCSDYHNESYLSYLLSALNNFSVHFAADSRGQLCILGEDLIPVLLPLWNKTSELVKVCSHKSIYNLFASQAKSISTSLLAILKQPFVVLLVPQCFLRDP